MKSNQGLDAISVDLKETVLIKYIEVLSQGGYGLHGYQGSLCIPNVDY